ncbi:hypothetical protein LEN26_000125 [Aphanomyces euteiches]|nr:hypothetical protein AeMF1_009325 [Aphanomyces euteiches]KAH9164256.1 hypothetical protein LEN26_000125 [Aphanomyces euteiches]KAH9197635.1 hypothetical protein AeNC1_000381 [Aphanomyces euteiches]
MRRPTKTSSKKIARDRPRRLSDDGDAISTKRNSSSDTEGYDEQYALTDECSVEESVGWLNCECVLSLLLIGVLVALPFNLHHTKVDLIQSRDNYIVKAVEMVKVGACDDAVMLYERALVVDDSAHIHNQMADALSQCGKTSEALAHYMFAIHLEETNKRKVPSLMAIGDLYLKNMNYPMASKSFESIVSILRDEPTTDLVEAYIKLAKVDVGRRSFSAAYSHYTAASDLIVGDTMQAEVHYRMGHCALVMGKLQLAIDNFKIACAKASPAQKSLFVHSLAYAYLEHGMIAKGNQELDQLFSTNSMYTEERYIRASFQDHHYSSGRAPAQYISQLFDLHAHRSDFPNNLDSFLQLHGILFVQSAPKAVSTALQEKIGVSEGDRWLDVIDLGCGSGSSMQYFRSLSNYVLGIDVSPISVENARRRLDMYDDLKIGDILDVGSTLPDSSCDLVLALNTLQYFGDLRQIFQLVQRLLRPGGTFAFNVDAFNEDANGHQFSLRFSGRWKHDTAYISELRSHFGFALIHSERIEDTQPFQQANGEPIRRVSDGKAFSDVYLFQKSEDNM